MSTAFVLKAHLRWEEVRMGIAIVRGVGEYTADCKLGQQLKQKSLEMGDFRATKSVSQPPSKTSVSQSQMRYYAGLSHHRQSASRGMIKVWDAVALSLV
jgi:hypothetical protein